MGGCGRVPSHAEKRQMTRGEWRREKGAYLVRSRVFRTVRRRESVVLVV